MWQRAANRQPTQRWWWRYGRVTRPVVSAAHGRDVRVLDMAAETASVQCGPDGRRRTHQRRENRDDLRAASRLPVLSVPMS